MKKQLHQYLVIFIATATIFISQKGFAWGQRAHHTICDAAVFLVKEPGLRSFLQNKPNMMGHLCNIPDIHWKNLGPEARKFGDAAHFIDTEVLGIPINLIPTDYLEIITKYTGTDNKFETGPIISIPNEFGSNWWRADQFIRRAVEAGKNLSTATPPSTPKEETDPTFPFNKFVFDFVVNLGLSGHFVGDNSQPFHITADYDGYHVGHGGIHGYYEDSVVAALPYDLHAKVVREAKNIQDMRYAKNERKKALSKFLMEKTVVEKMRGLAELSFADIPKVLKLDPVTKKSEFKTENGKTIKTPAVRNPADTVAKAYEGLVVLEMARSAALLAQIWDDAYVAIGAPKLASSKSYSFPMTPDFVMPDYYETRAPAKK